MLWNGYILAFQSNSLAMLWRIDWAFRNVCASEGYSLICCICSVCRGCSFPRVPLAGRKSIKCAWSNLFGLLKSRSVMNEKQHFWGFHLNSERLSLMVCLAFLAFMVHSWSFGVFSFPHLLWGGWFGWSALNDRILENAQKSDETTQLVRQGIRIRKF